MGTGETTTGKTRKMIIMRGGTVDLSRDSNFDVINN